ncbi:TraR/DksA family transcriptional regulator [Actinoalloteichus hymeniacidonis]|uniref:Transcriptional regulator, TraR/DksA family n=1 Tax=Actinoalloteichus hymeniacidonis TaxID=340345 RepID=A0AAC9HQW1_9PSEU|nr:TraR/DksA C4-type zinc finger protein [Actinoalloteichus hymeniacidonis]AOS63321.1 transcriptional regulator, TraR/DksA family [Actinoalloteichus hymeniacidonis]MBB5908640.1 RNA polymerase-binding transcription factor DksA [Actinoalloteichus hymeniacidonis]
MTAGDPHRAQQEFAPLLAAERATLLGLVDSLLAQRDSIAESSALSSGDDEHDPEGATLAYERAQVLSLLAETRRELDDLDRATERLASGTYGHCLRCGRLIPGERLTARPAATTCVGCADRIRR